MNAISPRADNLSARIADKSDDLIALTQDLIRIPTLNPPGENYHAICDYLERRLRKRGFHCIFERATGAPGDSDAYPRWNIIARREGKRAGGVCAFQQPH